MNTNEDKGSLFVEKFYFGASILYEYSIAKQSRNLTTHFYDLWSRMRQNSTFETVKEIIE